MRRRQGLAAAMEAELATRMCVEQAAAIPCRVTPRGGIHVLLVTTGSGQWGVPKGHVEDGEEHHEAAVREAKEEAGVVGRVVKPRVGEFFYDRDGEEHRVIVFAMRVEDVKRRWPEQRSRQRVWVTLREAQRLVGRAELRAILRMVDLGVLREPAARYRKVG